MVPRDAESGLSFVDVTDIPLSQIVYVGIDPGINKPIASVIVAPDGHAGKRISMSSRIELYFSSRTISSNDTQPSIVHKLAELNLERRLCAYL